MADMNTLKKLFFKKKHQIDIVHSPCMDLNVLFDQMIDCEQFQNIHPYYPVGQIKKNKLRLLCQSRDLNIGGLRSEYSGLVVKTNTGSMITGKLGLHWFTKYILRCSHIFLALVPIYKASKFGLNAIINYNWSFVFFWWIFLFLFHCISGLILLKPFRNDDKILIDFLERFKAEVERQSALLEQNPNDQTPSTT